MNRAVSTVVVNYQTPVLLKRTVESFLNIYPDVSLWIVENGSQDSSLDVCQSLASAFPGVIRVLKNDSNVFHGPAMDQAIRAVDTPYVFILDSDTETHADGFLEEMLSMMESDKDCYMVGQRVLVSERGFARTKGIPVPVSAHLLLRREMYLSLPPFEHHGLPVLKNCMTARERGWSVCSFPIEKYIDHIGRGTAEKYGYGLGLKSRWDYVLDKLGL